jgi:light-regulated signal transduction histidine kinase (bacteriophytochrome)
MESVQELHSERSAEPRAAGASGIQAGGYLLELSLDWIVLRASENIHHLLGQSHVTLIDEPLGRFVHAQALHDLRNLFSRLSGTTGIARAYGVRLTDDPDLFDLAFQLSDGRVLVEAVPSAGGLGECFGTVGGLAAGLAGHSGQALLDAGARRMRALTGYDRVTLEVGDRRAESSRGAFAGPAVLDGVPTLVADSAAPTVALFPRRPQDSAAEAALLRSPSPTGLAELGNAGVRSSLGISFGEVRFRCDSRTPRDPNFELHAAAELFAQLFAMQLEIDLLKKR